MSLLCIFLIYLIKYIFSGDTCSPVNGANQFMDFDAENYTVPYKRLNDALFGDSSGSAFSEIPYEDFGRFNCLHAFQLTPTNPSHLQLMRSNETQVYARFKKAVPTSGIQMICLIESQSLLSIDDQRNCLLEPPEV